MKALFLAILLSSATAQAAITIDCGYGIDAANGHVKERFFLITSRSHRLEGDAGRSWHLYDYLGGEVFNASMSSAANGNLLLMIQNGFLGMPGVGTEYEIEKPWGGSPLKAIGREKNGFSTGKVVNELDCVVSDH
jgi:hypothetical protein